MRYSDDRDSVPVHCQDLQDKVDTLFWLKKAMAQLPDLPNGRLKEELEARMDALRMASEDLPSYKRNYERILELEQENESLRTQVSSLMEVETCDSDPRFEENLPPVESKQSRVKFLIILVLIVTSFLVGRCGNGADLDLGGTRRTPDASAFQPSNEERSTRDVGIPTAPGKSGVSPVDYRHSPTTH